MIFLVGYFINSNIYIYIEREREREKERAREREGGREMEIATHSFF